MSFSRLNRRTHLYLGMALMPWFLMYGFSSIFFSHRLLDDYYKDGVPNWTLRWERDASYDVPSERGALQAFGESLSQDLGQDGPYHTAPFGERGFRMYRVDFIDHARITYDAGKGRLRWEDKRFRWDHFWTSFHARGGFHEGYPLNNLWSVIVDLFCLAVVVWIASGIIMWWQLKTHRRWGTLTLALGILSFSAFMIAF